MSLVTLNSRGGYVGLRFTGVGNGGGSGGPVGIFLQLQGQVHVAHLGGLVPSTEQPGQEGRSPAVICHLDTHRAFREKKKYPSMVYFSFIWMHKGNFLGSDFTKNVCISSCFDFFLHFFFIIYWLAIPH